ncbi:MAG TPA: 2-oxo-4-hydroxy-4-carboxy-5-ureidoimidazoline decarboxylase [Jatrophihabitans sp.]|nr:2-oxo-4-hydroxy-4-carboxy-5-ureidoimidazoline decarboxylase [Jatrophihabitans sp.]
MLDAFNSAAADELRTSLRACCAADAWIEAIIAGRPYADEARLAAVSDAATAALDDTGLGEALAGHPRIGDRGHGWSRQEQSGMAGASADVQTELAAANADYERRFGHVYLVCATGRSATELLAICRARLGNDPDDERAVVLGELAKINRLRLEKLLHPEAAR